MYSAINGKLSIDNEEMYYICFGKGDKTLIMLPGLGDGLKMVKGMAIPFSFLYRKFAQYCRVYVFSRKVWLPKEYSSKQMAGDVKKAMDLLGIQKASILGVSQGGTIAQYVAIDYPEVVDKLILTVTYPKANDTVKNVISRWIEYAQNKDYKEIFIDTAEKSYSEKYLRKNRKLYWLLTRIGVPQNYDRFITQAKACMSHDAYDLLSQIEAPTLIIGAGQDQIVTGEASIELSKLIKNSQLHIYDELGHGAYEEAEDFEERVLNFLE